MNQIDLANQIGALALAVSDDMRIAAETAAGEAGPAAAALVLTGHAPGLSIAELAQAVALSHPGTVRLVDRLAGSGLIARQPDPKDRRSVNLYLTAAGTERAAAVQAARGLPLQALVAGLTPDETAVLSSAVARLLAARTSGESDALRICRLCDHERCGDCPVELALTN